MPNQQTIWSGQVEFVVDEQNQKHMLYRKDGELTFQTYTPDGMIENRVFKSLLEKLK